MQRTRDLLLQFNFSEVKAQEKTKKQKSKRALGAQKAKSNATDPRAKANRRTKEYKTKSTKTKEKVTWKLKLLRFDAEKLSGTHFDTIGYGVAKN